MIRHHLIIANEELKTYGDQIGKSSTTNREWRKPILTYNNKKGDRQ